MKTEKTFVTVQATVKATVEKVWNFWTHPSHIINWNFASDDWHCPWVKNETREGAKFMWRMEAKDGSFGFDFSGRYNTVDPHKTIEYTLDDDRKVKLTFLKDGYQTHITEVFEAETENPVDLQKNGWQAILNNFKKYVETTKNFEKLHFEIEINVSPEKVYYLMLDEKHWNDWTSVFNVTSHFKGSWKKGSEIRFIGTDQNGKTGGMLGKIEENIPNRFVSIFYTGIIKEDKEITEGPEAEEWSGGHENYTFENRNGNTVLKIDFDSNPDFKKYFAETYPKALERLKSICEM